VGGKDDRPVQVPPAAAVMLAAPANTVKPARERPAPIDPDLQSVPPVLHRAFGLWDPAFNVPGGKGHVPLRQGLINSLLPMPYRAFANAWDEDLPVPWIQMLWDQHGAEVLLPLFHLQTENSSPPPWLTPVGGGEVPPQPDGDMEGIQEARAAGRCVALCSPQHVWRRIHGSLFVLRYFFSSMLLSLFCTKDLDVAPLASGAPTRFARLFQEHPDAGAIFFLESELTEEEAQSNGWIHRIRKGVPEDKLRISNYLMAARPAHPIMTDILKLAEPRACFGMFSSVGVLVRLAQERALLQVETDYDILYTTGPDLVSTVVNRNQYKDVVIIREREKVWGLLLCYLVNFVIFFHRQSMGFEHLISGGWRDQQLEWHHPSWDEWLATGKLGDWKPAWLRQDDQREEMMQKWRNDMARLQAAYNEQEPAVAGKPLANSNASNPGIHHVPRRHAQKRIYLEKLP
jgi:hypothetical protein